MWSDLPLPFQNNRLSPSHGEQQTVPFSRSTVDLSLVRDTRISEEATIQFRAEFFNLLNRLNLHLPDLFLGSPTFGRILSAGEPRHIQLGLKLLF